MMMSERSEKKPAYKQRKQKKNVCLLIDLIYKTNCFNYFNHLD